MTPIFQRATALGLLALSVGLAVTAIAVPLWSTYIDSQLELRLVRERHASLVARRKDAAPMKRHLEALVKEAAGAGLVTATSNEEVARLAERQIRSLLEGEQVILSKWTVLPGNVAYDIGVFKAELAFLIPPARLSTVLSALERTVPTVLFDRVSVSRRKRGFATDGSRPETLVEVSGAVKLLFVTPELFLKGSP